MTITDPVKLGTILGVWAHPDDEAFMAAGVLATATKNGQPVVCVTATRGELGVQDALKWPQTTLGQVREQEMADCMRVLGIKDHRFLDYHDGSCLPDDTGAVSRLVKIMEEVQPDTILTWGPPNQAVHGDHKAVCIWVTKAAHIYKKAKLYYSPESDEGYPATVGSGVAIDFELSEELSDIKYRAICAHASQLVNARNKYGEEFLKTGFRRETFSLAEASD